MPYVRIPYSHAVRTLSQYGDKALKSHIYKGKYFGPLVCRRMQANLRKQAVVDGTYGKFTPGLGGWNPDWDKPRKVALIKPNKGHARDRTRADRFAKIQKAMEAMPDRIKKHKKDIADRKPKKDLDYRLKRLYQISLKTRGPGPPPRKAPSMPKKAFKIRALREAARAAAAKNGNSNQSS